MTDTRNNGGPAFPQSTFTQAYPEHSGMDLRDWFAGQALSGYLASGTYSNGGDGFDTFIAKKAYNAADAMLATRSSSKEA